LTRVGASDKSGRDDEAEERSSVHEPVRQDAGRRWHLGQ
jgi:hypothetical protein